MGDILHSSAANCPNGTLNQGWVYCEQVPPPAAGMGLLDYYANYYPHSSRTDWLQRIELGQVQVNDQRVAADTPLETGQRLTYHRPPWSEPNVPLNFEVLYEDELLWAIAKPSGLPVLPGGGFLQHTLLHQLRCRYPDATPVPIHRLGRGTSGVMVVARSPQARAHLSRQLRDRTMTKVYRALVGAGTMPDQFTITTPIGKIPHPTLGYVYGASDTGKSAHSECHVMGRYGDRPSITPYPTTLLAVKIHTGRPHQIRIHLAAYGYPLIGDPLYDVGGKPKPISSGQMPTPGDCGYWLHAHQLGFTHPGTHERLHITCPPPPPLQG
ncbi:MAG: RluA family pseudouridine synthase [Leptolyngbyaceae bacterium]|nr:RluA family pseudouridine synthase [Leptolyngbyaceae bacterium]